MITAQANSASLGSDAHAIGGCAPAARSGAEATGTSVGLSSRAAEKEMRKARVAKQRQKRPSASREN